MNAILALLLVVAINYDLSPRPPQESKRPIFVSSSELDLRVPDAEQPNVVIFAKPKPEEPEPWWSNLGKPATSPFASEDPPPTGGMGALIHQPGPRHLWTGDSENLLWHLRGPYHNMKNLRYLKAIGPEQWPVLHDNLHNTRKLWHTHPTREPPTKEN